MNDDRAFDVFTICNAYESGVGHGGDNLPNPYPEGTDHYVAYDEGKKHGALMLERKKREKAERPVAGAAVPDCFLRLAKLAHGMTFGEDWNKGTHAAFHRQSLIDASKECQEYLSAAPSSQAGENKRDAEFGLPASQEPKYTVNTRGRITNRATGKPIPDDEPVFLIRAKDTRAVNAILYYAYLAGWSTSEHGRAVLERVKHFKDFAAAHPGRMQEPDTAMLSAQSASARNKNG